MTAAAGAWMLGLIAAIWVVSDIGYYLLPPLIGLAASYNEHPVWSAAYYAVWIVVTFAVFRRQFSALPPQALRPSALIVAPLLVVAFAAYAILIPPLLPEVTWQETGSPPDILLADPWYFLPKSVDILFQQMLIVVLVLALSVREHDLRRISVLCAMLFGGTHLLLAFGGLPLMYVIRFTIFATLFGFLFPWLILKVRNGLLWSYGLHWVYYAATLITAHTISPYVE